MSIVKDFVKALVKSEHSADLFEKLGEAALDSELTDSLLKDVPLIGIIQRMYKTGNAITAYFFCKKLVKFLGEIEQISPQNRKDFFDRYCSDVEQEMHVGEVTLMILDKLDHPMFAKMLGRAFAMLVEGKIHPQVFEMYAYIIRGLSPYLLRQLHQIYQAENVECYDPATAAQLANYGLVDEQPPMILGNPRGNILRQFRKNDFGRYFYEHVVNV